MRLVKVASYYGAYVRGFYRNRPSMAYAPYETQLSALLSDCFSWADFYGAPLARLGYETIEIIRDADPLQRAWARARGLEEGSSLEVITAQQILEAHPDVLWFEDSSAEAVEILARLESKGLRPRLVMGWTGSYIPPTDIYAKVDLTLSCAPETAEWLRSHGAKAEHLDHAFSRLVLDRVTKARDESDLAFFGNIIRSDGFHRARAELLSRIVTGVRGTKVYSPQLTAGTADPVRLAIRTSKSIALYPAKLTVFALAYSLAAAGIPKSRLARNRYFKRAFELDGPPRPLPPPNDIPEELLPFALPPMFGVSMYEAIRASRIVLNVHADSSPLYASNMRLFEVTGAGSLLLTDWRNNLPDLFDPDREVVAYRSPEECLEKATWLLEHEEKRAKIASSGQTRCLKDHTFENRALALDAAIKSYMK